MAEVRQGNAASNASGVRPEAAGNNGQVPNGVVGLQQTVVADPPRPDVLPDWMYDYFPLLSKNGIFLNILYFLQDVFNWIVSIPFVSPICALIWSMLKILKPSIKVTKWTIFIFVYPWLALAKLFLTVFGFTKLAKDILRKYCAAVDSTANFLITASFKWYEYSKGSWGKMVINLWGCVTEMAGDFKEVIVTAVKCTKVVYTYLHDVYVKLTPESVRAMVTSWARNMQRVIAATFNVIRNIIIYMDECITLIIRTWILYEPITPEIEAETRGSGEERRSGPRSSGGGGGDDDDDDDSHPKGGSGNGGGKKKLLKEAPAETKCATATTTTTTSVTAGHQEGEASGSGSARSSDRHHRS